ncbi:MAG: hypothetical protein IJO08_03305 [Clostridia bacterium]|nr:hypothetical protein [Clostridia bacterium]
MKKEKIVTIIVLMILMTEMIAIPVKFVYNKFNQSDMYTVNTPIDWKELYPFEEDYEKDKKQNLMNKYKNFVSSIIGKVDVVTNNNTLFHDEFVYLYGWLNRNIGMKIVKDTEITTVLLNSGQFNQLYKPRENIEKTVQDVKDLSKYIEEKNMKFMYMQVPLKIFSEKDIVPGCIDNYIYADKKALRETLLKNNIDVFDVFKYSSDGYEEYMNYFYDTDHHWKTETGLTATKLLAEYLNEKYNFEINTDIYDINNYNLETYENAFLGSFGKKVTKGYTDAENFNLITPKDIQKWCVKIPQVGLEESGDFDLVIDKKVLQVNDLYKSNPYAVYTYGDQPYISIENNNEEVKGKILILGDSSSEVVVPFLAMGCEKVDRIDLRHFNGSLRNFLDNNYYDVVILLLISAGEEYDPNLHDSVWNFE